MELRKIRKNKNLTQKQVADSIGIGMQAYSYYEKEQRQAPYQILCRLADFFGVTVDEILGRTTAPQLFDNGRIERPQVLEMYEQLTPHQQALVMERMQAFIDTNREYNQQKRFLATPVEFIPAAKRTDEDY